MRRMLVLSGCLLVSACLAAGAPPETDHAKKLRRTPGEILPELRNPNLLKNPCFEEGLGNWTVLKAGGSQSSAEKAVVDGLPALKIDSKGGPITVFSDPIAVEPGKKYVLTETYHAETAGFGTFAQVEIINDSDAGRRLDQLREPQVYGALGGKEIYNRRPGEWQRVTKTFVPVSRKNDGRVNPNDSTESLALGEGQAKVRVAITQYGTPATVWYGGFYFGEQSPDTRKTEWGKYTENYDPRLPAEEVSRQLAARPDSTAEVVMSDYPRIFVDGNPTPSLVYFGDAFKAPRSKMVDFQKAGVTLQVLSLHNNLKIWRGGKDYDFKKMDAHLLDAISRNPQGNFIIRMDVTPYEKWKDEFPEHVAVDSAGKQTVGRAGNHAPPCYWSGLYREQVRDFLIEAVRHMRSQPYFKAVVGFFLTGNEDGQFYYQVVDKTLQDGNSKGASELFREWLRGQYKSEEELRASWNRKDVKFETVTPPIKTEKYKGCFFNPASNRPEMDFVRFLNESMGEFANQMCAAVKKEAGKKVLAVMWWGRGATLCVYPHFAQTKVVFPSRDMDLMGAQPSYAGERENGSSCFIPWVFDSTRTHAKIPMIEADFRTWISQYKSLDHDYAVVRYWNMYDLGGALLREYGKMMSVGGGLWWYDMTAGWFKTPEIMDLIGKINESAKVLSAKTDVFSPAEMVFVSDERNYYNTTEQANVWNGPNYHCVRGNQRALLRSGLKYDSYYLDDIVKKKMTNYKVYVFMNAFEVSDETRAFIENNLKKDNKTIVWLYAPGYIGKSGLGEEGMEKLTGMRIRLDGDGTKRASFVSGDSPLLAGIADAEAGIGLDMPGERFAVSDDKALPLAVYKKDGKIAAAVRKFDGWTSVYMGVPAGLTPQFLRNIAEASGVHVHNSPAGDMFFHHRDDLICMHGVEGKTNRVTLSFDAKVRDLMTGEAVPVAGRSFTVKLQPGETRLLYLEKGR